MTTVQTEAALEAELKKLPEVHRAQVTAYADERAVNGVKDSTLYKNVRDIVDWSRSLGEKPFAAATTQDARLYIQSRGRDGARLSVATTNQRKLILRSFQRWVRGGSKRDPYPPEVAWLEIVQEKASERVLEEVLTRDELARLIVGQNHPMDRALLAVLYDSGMRASEICSLRLRDVALDEYGAVLRLQKGAPGLKTGARHVRIIHSVPYLLKWLNDHPHKTDPNSSLWMSRSPRSFLKPLTANGLHKKVQGLGGKANLGRPIWPHLFRHSRATEAAKEGWSEAEMRLFFGWARNSDMPSCYIHLAGKDVDEAVLRRAGKLKGGVAFQPALAMRVCVCGHENPATSDFCESPGCGKPLTVKAAEKQQANTVQAVLEALKSHPGMYAGLGNDLLRQGVGHAGGGE